MLHFIRWLDDVCTEFLPDQLTGRKTRFTRKQSGKFLNFIYLILLKRVVSLDTLLIRLMSRIWQIRVCGIFAKWPIILKMVRLLKCSRLAVFTFFIVCHLFSYFLYVQILLWFGLLKIVSSVKYLKYFCPSTNGIDTSILLAWSSVYVFVLMKNLRLCDRMLEQS